MHPIERLRHLARAEGADPAVVAREAAGALGSFRDDPAGLVTACRRLLDRHPASAPLWTLASRVLTAPDPMAEAWQVVDLLEGDRTSGELSHLLPEDATVCVLGWPDQIAPALARRGDLEVLVVDALGEGSGLALQLDRADVAAVDVPVGGLGPAVVESDVVCLDAFALGEGGYVSVLGARAAAATARHAGVPLWVVAGEGRVLPPALWRALVGRLAVDDDPWDVDCEVVPLDLLDTVVGPVGPRSAPDALARLDCPVAPELLRAAG